jgi:sterol desaturase/sphingolipid hydroxylase (fatty acid hydroxylase superfamily)
VPVTGWKQLAPGYFYTTLVVCLIALTHSEEFSWRQNVIFVCFGVLSWTLIEYVLHRFIFHYNARSDAGRKFVYAAHLSHHETPRTANNFFSSLVISLPIATAYVLLAWIVTGSLHAAAYLFAGLAAGYLCYEWLHFQAHHRRPRLRLLRYLRKYHLLHHYQTPELRFGVTSPLLDMLMGTFRPVRKRRLSHKETQETQRVR